VIRKYCQRAAYAACRSSRYSWWRPLRIGVAATRQPAGIERPSDSLTTAATMEPSGMPGPKLACGRSRL